MAGKKQRGEDCFDVRFRVGGGVVGRVEDLGKTLGLSVHETFRYLALKSLEASTALNSLNSMQKMIETFETELSSVTPPRKPERKAKS